MTQYNMPEDIADYINALEKRLVALEKFVRAGNTSIDNGALLIKKDGKVIMGLGDLKDIGYNAVRPDGTPQMGVVIKRDTGELALSMWDGDPNNSDGYQQYFGIWDRSGNVIMSDDATAGWGLGTPYIHMGMWITSDQSKWPSTTSSSFVTAWDTMYHVQHPKLYVDFLVLADVGTVGEGRIMIDGVQYGTTVQTDGTGWAYFQQALSLPKTMHLKTKQIYIEYRRVSGTGTVKAHPRGGHGRQS